MKKIVFSAVVSVLSAALVTGCTEGNNTAGSTVVGAAAGGLAGGLLFHGSGMVPGIIGGALLGGVIGNQVGRYMDRQDRANMQSAIVSTPVGQEATWTNPKSNVTYQVRPVKNYKNNGNYCREYQTRVQIDGKWQSAYGHACRMPDGSWKIVS